MPVRERAFWSTVATAQQRFLAQSLLGEVIETQPNLSTDLGRVLIKQSFRGACFMSAVPKQL
jgi:hypothetical protein